MHRYTRTAALAALLGVGLATAVVPARQLASRPADDWSARLERPDRIAGLRLDYIVQSLALKADAVVADIGAGPGVLSLPLARAVPAGTVYAVEIDQGFLDRIQGKTREAGLRNVVTVLGEYGDPKLPARDVDLALFHDVLHHVKDRAGYLKAVARYIKPGGRMAVVELPPDGSHKDEPELVVTKEQVKDWMGAAGFSPVQEFDGLQGKWFVVYAHK